MSECYHEFESILDMYHHQAYLLHERLASGYIGVGFRISELAQRDPWSLVDHLEVAQKSVAIACH